ncbi:MAG: pyridoxal-phosphate dependent enzyme [bacterium]
MEAPGAFPREALAERPANMWRYREALPIGDDKCIVSLDEGMTPLVPLPFAGREVHCKLDFLFPTGSFKDRGAALLISKIREWGIGEILGDSSGNAAAAIAAYAARAGIECDMYVPADTSPAKCAQIAAYGARLCKIPGPRQAATDAAMAAAGSRFYASHFWNCWFNHGTKTWAFEVWEQLGGRAPGAVIVPAGHGSMLIGAHKGFGELLAAGRIERMPRIYAVQAARCAPLARMWAEDLDALPDLAAEGALAGGATLAEGISIVKPIRWKQMLAAVRESGGEVLAVEDAALPPILREMARRGVLMEPTSAVPFAGAKALARAGKLADLSTVVIPVTGHGLKAADKLEKILGG